MMAAVGSQILCPMLNVPSGQLPGGRGSHTKIALLSVCCLWWTWANADTGYPCLPSPPVGALSAGLDTFLGPSSQAVTNKGKAYKCKVAAQPGRQLVCEQDSCLL